MHVAGVDEAGRGPLAGPVVAAAVILAPKTRLPGLTDSKLLTEKQRETLFDLIIKRAISFGVGLATVEEIDEFNILQATFLAMKRAVLALKVLPNKIIVDGNQTPKWDYPTEAIIGGDLSERAISAASVLAKVERDRIMCQLELDYPGYGFAKHKGYGTEEHLKALRSLGPSLIHRRSFSPVTALLTPITSRASTLPLDIPIPIEDVAEPL